MSNRDPQNLYTAARANDPGVEVIDMVIRFYKGNRATFTGTEATNIGNEITNILNGTHKV